MEYARLRDYALSLPETTEAPHFDYGSFRVKGKIFATVPPDRKFVHVFVDPEQRDQAIALHPGHVEPLLWGKKVLGVRIELAPLKAPFVQGLLRNAWLNKAQKTLAKAFLAKE